MIPSINNNEKKMTITPTVNGAWHFSITNPDRTKTGADIVIDPQDFSDFLRDLGIQIPEPVGSLPRPGDIVDIVNKTEGLIHLHSTTIAHIDSQYVWFVTATNRTMGCRIDNTIFLEAS